MSLKKQNKGAWEINNNSQDSVQNINNKLESIVDICRMFHSSLLL